MSRERHLSLSVSELGVLVVFTLQLAPEVGGEAAICGPNGHNADVYSEQGTRRRGGTRLTLVREAWPIRYGRKREFKQIGSQES